MPRTRLERRARKGQDFIIDDPKRFDGHKHAVSLSITFPNNLMFFKLHNQTGAESWVILSLDPLILWELDCAFFSENAASARMRQIPLAELKQVDALQTMFAETVFVQGIQVHRADLAISPAYPTNPRAEVLTCQPIKPRYIREVAFCNNRIRSCWTASNGADWTGITFSLNSGFYRSRPGNWDHQLRDLESANS